MSPQRSIRNKISKTSAALLGRKGTPIRPIPVELVDMSFLLFPRSKTNIYSTNKTVLLVPRANHDWMESPSIKTLRYYTDFLIKEKIRRFGGSASRKYGKKPTCTHYVGTADLAINLGHKLAYPTEVIAFAAYAHDLIEDFRKLGITPEQIVGKCWKGDEEYKELLINTIKALTDPEALEISTETSEVETQTHNGEINVERIQNRHLDQIRVAKSDVTGLVSHIRFCDKLATLAQDYNTLLDGRMPFLSERKFREYFRQRRIVVEKLDVSPRLKRWYMRALAKVETGLVDYEKYGRARGLNDILDPICYVFRNESDGNHTTRRSLGALAP